MYSILPEREILKAVTDKNIDSAASRARVDAFNYANVLSAVKSPEVEIVIEGILYSNISQRLGEEHKKIFRFLYKIDDSAVDVSNYNITKAIKFIIEEKKLKVSTNKVFVLTDNPKNYSEFLNNPNFKVFTPIQFIRRTQRFLTIKSRYKSIEDAIITAYFVE